ncbi:Protein of unknown function [Bacillus cereus]|nr:Protein of unknown function [Bacillus cereus]
MPYNLVNAKELRGNQTAHISPVGES